MSDMEEAVREAIDAALQEDARRRQEIESLRLTVTTYGNALREIAGAESGPWGSIAHQALRARGCA